MAQLPDALKDCMQRLIQHCRKAALDPTSLNLTNIRLWATNLEGWLVDEIEDVPPTRKGSVRDRFMDELAKRGMFDYQAREVMKIVEKKTNDIAINYSITWDRPAEEYPEALYGVLWECVRESALEWIDANIPQAWFRPAFEV